MICAVLHPLKWEKQSLAQFSPITFNSLQVHRSAEDQCGTRRAGRFAVSACKDVAANTAGGARFNIVHKALLLTK
jgi:hypothetical protein